MGKGSRLKKMALDKARADFDCWWEDVRHWCLAARIITGQDLADGFLGDGGAGREILKAKYEAGATAWDTAKFLYRVCGSPEGFRLESVIPDPAQSDGRLMWAPQAKQFQAYSGELEGSWTFSMRNFRDRHSPKKQAV